MLLQISVLALIGNMSAAVINPAFVPLGKAFSITTVEASYELTVYVNFPCSSIRCSVTNYCR